MRGRLRIAAALACAAVAVLASGAYASGVRAEVEQERSETLERYGGEVTQLVVATRELEAGETLSASDLEVRDWLSEMAPEGSFSSLDDVVGERLTSAVAEGMPLTETSLRAGDSAIDVPKGQVATTVSLEDRLGLAEGVSVGERLLAFESADDGTHLLSDSVTVLAVDADQATLAGSGSVTVAMSPSVVNEFLRCASSGTLRLVLPASDVSADELGGFEAPSEVGPEDEADGDAASDVDDGAAEAEGDEQADEDGGAEDGD